METEDIHSKDDIKDVEDRLYGQIHHDDRSPQIEINKKPSLPVITNVISLHNDETSQFSRMVTSTSVNNIFQQKKIPSRYWSNGNYEQTISNINQQLVKKSSQPQAQSKKFQSPQTISQQRPATNTVKDSPPLLETDEKSFKAFQPYESIIHTKTTDKANQADLFNECKKSAQHSAENKQVITQKTQNNTKKVFSKIYEHSKPSFHNKFNSQIGNFKDFTRSNNYNEQQSNSETVPNTQDSKYLNRKKRKRKRDRSKLRKKKQKLELIDLRSDENDDDDDDVMIVPLPPPAVLTITDTSEEDEPKAEGQMVEQAQSGSFVRPRDPNSSTKNHDDKATNNNAQDINSSRCTSPCSVISADDFIVQTDRTRVSRDKDIATDDDLVCVHESVKSFMDNRESHQDVDKNKQIEIPLPASDDPKNVEQQTKSAAQEYRQKQSSSSSYQALDIYCESESDAVLDSVYSKGHTTAKSNLIQQLTSESSVDEKQDFIITQKVKRLRKRRASSSNKESEPNNDSSDSESSGNVSEKSTIMNSLPFISRGEAVETTKLKRKSRFSGTSAIEVNSSDIEFLNMLTLISQSKVNNTGNPICLDQVSEESDKSEHEDITARNIAEEILNKNAKKSKLMTKCTNSVTKKDHAKQMNDKELLNSDDLQKHFDCIDKMQIGKSQNLHNIPEPVVAPDDADMNIEDVNKEKRKRDSSFIEKEDTILEAANIKSVEKSNTNIVYSISEKYIGWNEEMIRFYDYSWGDEKFNINKIRRNMDRKSKWSIITEDRFQTPRKLAKYRCNNCLEKGHFASKCHMAKKPLVCTMCGEKGHREPRCPNTICLRCGRPTRVFTKGCKKCFNQSRLVCPICKIRGHGIEMCPDKWRRYHSTVKANTDLNNEVTYSSRRYCCICAGNGHLPEYCKLANRFTEYPLSITEIKAHSQTYPHQPKLTTVNVGTYNLLYEPDDKILFNFSNNVKFTRKQYYGRFLKAVGLTTHSQQKQPKKRKTTSQECEEPRDKIPKLTCESESSKIVINPFAKIMKKRKNVVEINENNVIDDDADVSLNIDPKLNESLIQEIVDVPVEIEYHDYDSDLVIDPTDSEYQFKLPESVSDTASNKEKSPDKNSNDSNAQDTITKEPLNIDSDSNYSFSDHFELNTTNSTAEPQEQLPRPMEVLPDFISLNNNTDDDSDYNETALGISKNFDTDGDIDIENTFSLNDIPCSAKVVLTKCSSKYLLSATGNQFLIENSNKYDVKASIEWTSVGNVLVLEGLRANQDKFHTKLMLAFKSIPDTLQIRAASSIEKSQQVPRKRIKMVRFLSEHFRQLQYNRTSSVTELFKQLKIYESNNSQTSWKMADRTRRTLNMVLFGQAGLRNGSKNLDSLVTSLKVLLFEPEEESITPEMRDSISKSWKYIFSSQKHENYDELVQIYNEKKRNHELPILKIDARLLGEKFLDVTFTQEQKDKMLESNVNYLYANNKNVTAAPQQTSIRLEDIPKVVSKFTFKVIDIPPAPKTTPNISLNISKEKLPPSSDPRNSEWENQCINLLTPMEHCTKNCSLYWSKQTVNILKTCCTIYAGNPVLHKKFQNILDKAYKGLMSHEDHKTILKISQTKRTES